MNTNISRDVRSPVEIRQTSQAECRSTYIPVGGLSTISRPPGNSSVFSFVTRSRRLCSLCGRRPKEPPSVLWNVICGNIDLNIDHILAKFFGGGLGRGLSTHTEFGSVVGVEYKNGMGPLALLAMSRHWSRWVCLCAMYSMHNIMRYQ